VTAPASPPTLPHLSGVSNFRDIGGLPVPGGSVRRRCILRSAHLGEATEADVAMLAALGLRTIVDFRTAADRAVEPPDRVPPGTEHVWLPMPDPGGRAAELRDLLGRRDLAGLETAFGNGQALAFSLEGVVKMATDEAQTECYRAFVDLVVDPGRWPLLFHCSAGKDRAGWAATIVLMALGADDTTLVAHYVESNVHRRPDDRVAHYAQFGVRDEWIRPLVSVHEDYLRAGLAAVERHWGGRDAYLRDGLGLDVERLDALRAALVQP
jgi:protein-tyrosine phosphatase